MAANISKTFLTHLKRDNLKQLVDLGNLRSHKDFSIQSELIPQLVKQTAEDLRRDEEIDRELFSCLHKITSDRASKHQKAIQREIIRCKEARAEAEIRNEETQAAAKLRRQKRAALRE